VADELRRQADNFIELQDLAAHVARAHPVRPEPAHHGQANDHGVAQNV
jgi:hypothetical protein